MAHFMIENPYISNTKQYGRGIDSPRPFRFQLTNFANSPKRVRKSSSEPMWLNFKNNEQNGGSGAPGKPARNAQSAGINRQNSSQSSIRSNRSSSSLLKKKIEQHAFQTNTAEWQKEQDYKIIRERRKKLRRQINAKLKLVKRLFILSVLGIILGVIVLFGSTIRTLGDGSIFWTHKTYFKYVGVFLIVAGVILLLSAVGMESHSLDKLKQEGIVEVKPFIHPDFLLESDQKISSPEYSPDNNYNTNCTGLDKQQLLWKQEHNDGEEGFLCSSISSATSNSQVQGNDLTSRWARAMTMSFDACDAGQKSPQGEANAKNILVRKNSAQLRALNNAPSIEISSVDEISNCKSRSSSSSSIFGSFSGSSSGSSIHRVKVNDHEKSFKSTADESNVLKSGAPLHNISEESLAVIDDRKITSSHLVM